MAGSALGAFRPRAHAPLELLSWATEFNWLLQPAMILLAAAMGIYAVGARRLTRPQAIFLLTPLFT